MNQKKISYGLLVLLFGLLLTACSETPDAYDSKGNPIYLSDYQGKWLYINFWATWCRPCIEELPDLDAFQQSNSDRVQVLGINFDKLSNSDIEAFNRKVNVHFPLIRELSSDTLALPTPSTLPTTYIINPQGQLVETLHGPQTLADLESTLAAFRSNGQG